MASSMSGMVKPVLRGGPSIYVVFITGSTYRMNLCLYIHPGSPTSTQDSCGDVITHLGFSRNGGSWFSYNRTSGSSSSSSYDSYDVLLYSPSET